MIPLRDVVSPRSWFRGLRKATRAAAETGKVNSAKPAPARRRKILVTSNCQTTGVAIALKVLLPEFDVEALPVTELLNPMEKDFERLRGILRSTDFWVTTPDGIVTDCSSIPGLRIIRIPQLMFRAFHPDMVYARRKSTGKRFPTGEYNSLIALWAWEQGLSARQTRDLYRESLLAELGYMSLWNTSVEVLKNRFLQTDIDFKSFYAYAKRLGIFMHTFNHPVQRAVNHMAWQAAKVIDPRVGETDISSLDILADPVDWYIWPVYPSIAESLSLNGSYRWKRFGSYQPTLEAFIEESFSLYKKEGVVGGDVLYEDSPVAENVISRLNREIGRQG